MYHATRRRRAGIPRMTAHPVYNGIHSQIDNDYHKPTMNRALELQALCIVGFCYQGGDDRIINTVYGLERNQ